MTYKLNKKPNFKPRKTRLQRAIWGAVIFLIPFIIYLNSFHNDFLAGDDEEIILRNNYLRDWRYTPKFFTENYKSGAGTISNFWRPFQLLVYSLIVHTVGVKPLPFHLSSILFHSLCGLFLYLLFLKLLPQEIPLSAIAAIILLWLVHPIHNEELAVTSGIASPAHLFWMILGLFSFVHFEEKERWGWLALSLAGFTLALCSKESAIVFPGLLLGLHIAGIKAGVFKKIKVRGFIYKHMFFWAVAFLYLIGRLTVLNFQNTLNFYAQSNIFTENFSYRLYTLFTVLTYGLRIIIFPSGLHPEKSWPVFTNFFSTEVFLSFLILIVIFVLAVIKWRKNPIFAFGIFWFFLSYLPMSNLAAKINALVWNHWFYTPAVGIFLSLAALLQVKMIQRIAFIFIIAAVIIFSGLTVSRSHLWKDTETVSRFILTYEPESAKTWNNLAIALDAKGEYQEAVNCYLKAIGLSDVYPQTHHNLANTYFALGKYDLAEKEYLHALSLDNNFYHSYLGLGKLYFSKGQAEKAAAYFKKALEIYPYLPPEIVDFIKKNSRGP